MLSILKISSTIRDIYSENSYFRFFKTSFISKMFRSKNTILNCVVLWRILGHKVHNYKEFSCYIIIQIYCVLIVSFLGSES